MGNAAGAIGAIMQQGPGCAVILCGIPSLCFADNQMLQRLLHRHALLLRAQHHVVAAHGSLHICNCECNLQCRGRSAVSGYRVVQALGDGSASLVEWQLQTGRTHQIRSALTQQR